MWILVFAPFGYVFVECSLSALSHTPCLLHMFLSCLHFCIFPLEVIGGSLWPGAICLLSPQAVSCLHCRSAYHLQKLTLYHMRVTNIFSSFFYTYSGILITHIVEFSIFILCLTFNFNPRQLSFGNILLRFWGCKVSTTPAPARVIDSIHDQLASNWKMNFPVNMSLS